MPQREYLRPRSVWLCRIVAVLAVPTAAVVPCAALWALSASSLDGLAAAAGLADIAVRIDLPPARRAAVVAMLTLPSLLLAAAILRLAPLFRRLARQRVFEVATYQPLIRFACLLGASAAMGVASRIAASATISATWPGGPAIAIRLGTPEAFALGVAALTYLLARVLAEACAIASENEAFV